MRSEPIIVEQVFSKSIEEVWSAITKHEEMIQWFFENIPDFKAEVGFKTKFNVDAGERQYMHLWTIEELIPLKKIVYNWTYENMDGKAFIHFDLFKQDGQTMLRLTNIGLDSFPEDIPEFTRESCIGGWQYFINQRLKEYLEK